MDTTHLSGQPVSVFSPPSQQYICIIYLYIYIFLQFSSGNKKFMMVCLGGVSREKKEWEFYDLGTDGTLHLCGRMQYIPLEKPCICYCLSYLFKISFPNHSQLFWWAA